MSELRIIVTGGKTRDRHKDYLTLEDIITTRERALTEEGGGRCGVVIVQQGRPDGADAMARRLARDKGYEIETCEPDYDRYFLDAVTPSNQEMSDRGADLCVAMPSDPRDGGGEAVWDMIWRATFAGIETRIYPEAGHERQ